MEVVTETNIENKKTLKKQFVRVGANLLVGEVFLFIGVIVMEIALGVYYVIKENGLNDGNIENAMNKVMENPFLSIIPVLIGFIPIMHFIKRNIGKERIFSENKKFTLKNIFILFTRLVQ